MTVYPDLAVLIGILIHGSIIRLIHITLDFRRSTLEMIFIVSVSGILSGLSLIPIIPTVVIILISFSLFFIFLRGKSIQGTLRNIGTGFIIFFLYLGSFICLSGTIFGLSCIVLGGSGYFYLSFFRTVISAILSFFILRLFLLNRKKKRMNRYGECMLLIEGKQIVFRAFVDTGNFLKDPISGLPVALMEYSLLRKYLGTNFPAPLTCEFATRFSCRAKVIPFRSVSGNGEMLSAFVPELFFVNDIPKKVIVAVINRNIETRGQYSGIISPDLIGGES